MFFKIKSWLLTAVVVGPTDGKKVSTELNNGDKMADRRSLHSSVNKKQNHCQFSQSLSPLPNMCSSNPHSNLLLLVLLLFSSCLLINSRKLDLNQHKQLDHGDADDSLTYIWPLPWNYTFGNQTLTVDPNLSLVTKGNGGNSVIVSEAFDRYKKIIFEHSSSKLDGGGVDYDLTKLDVIVHSGSEELQLGVDESYTLMVAARDELSVIGGITIEVLWILLTYYVLRYTSLNVLILVIEAIGVLQFVFFKMLC